MRVRNGPESEKKRYRSMELVTFRDFKRFVAEKKAVTIEKVKVKIDNEWKIKLYGPQKDYVMESETVWSFPNRGNWATHLGNYRGNWSPFIPRNLILKYTRPGDLVLDQMVGSGTTMVECKLLGRNAIGVDINRDAIMVTLDRLNFTYNSLDPNYPKNLEIRTFVGDARNLDEIESNSVDLIATHPPYSGIIAYTKNRVEGDLSSLKLEDYIRELRIVAEEAFRVLSFGKCCAVLIGDTRKHLHYVPISYRVLKKFLEVGFVLKENIIKLQWKMKTTREKWRGKSYDFYRIAHENLYVFRKPLEDETISRIKYSSRHFLSE